ncbi:cytochrome c oxidase assembly protein COX20, mitochondrial-like [Rhopilema esculentum]|uniref:cytochrome c oxidase assembly protein COX20, mitochondrial-like n=1 Tax=Rhopilema esculentum TaxID=499914 RepID=UPI0031CE9044
MADEKDAKPTKKNPFTIAYLKDFIENTPCARNSLLYGLVGGMTVGTSKYMYSKHIRRSCDYAVASFALVSIGSWQLCRYLNWKQRKEIDKTVELLTKYSNSKGSDNDQPKIV